ncbi:MAG: alanine--tRNA ligase, partial [Candidatus Latescibacteria bacterium]|nr:alanine--tRNA ligase [Candidatus Latescibacterota bacterium]
MPSNNLPPDRHNSMTATELRQSFLDFFSDHDHTIVPSSPVVPLDDPTLLFTNAGMNQFKDVFIATGTRPYSRAVDTQKCIRAGGKHNDLEEVGKDGTHHTFFEMLGNWSFGDYYKREAIAWGWEYLTDRLGLPKHLLRATVHHTDDEAEELWYEVTDIERDAVSRHGDKDNFWEMADVGPCGPCSEIHLDLGGLRGCGEPDCAPNCVKCEEVHDSRFIELWNLVFIQYNRDENGILNELPAKHVDTGLGFERICAVVQGKSSNYDTDIFAPIIAAISNEVGVEYDPGESGTPIRIIADHIRALTFAIADGGFPSNVGRGYVLRRILRRAARSGRQLGVSEPFLFRLTDAVSDTMDEAFPELNARRDHVASVIKAEEERFGETLDRGIALFESVAAKTSDSGKTVVPGADVFRLYDTYGFPVDLTAVMAEELGLTLDLEGFDESMSEQRARSEAAGKFASSGDLIGQGFASQFVGYETLTSDSQIIALGDGQIVLDQTPFYAESGGQLSDVGLVTGDGFTFHVEEVRRQGDAIIHLGRLEGGEPEIGTAVVASVDDDARRATERNHSATHLLQGALRKTLGDHVSQSGSMVAPDRLRFDFTQIGAVEPDQLDQVEALVNQAARSNSSVDIIEKSLEQAKNEGVVALFGEKYGDVVRTVRMGESYELCGGTHVRATGEIGLFRVVSESSVAAGIRRIEAVSGSAAEELARQDRQRLKTLSQTLKAAPDELPDRIDALLSRQKELEKRLSQAQQASSGDKVGEWLAAAETVSDVTLVAQAAENTDSEALRGLADQLRDRLSSGVAVL